MPMKLRWQRIAHYGCKAMGLTGVKLTNMKELIKTIVTQPEIKINVVGFEVTSVLDNPINKTVTANVNLITDTGEKYDRSGVIVWQGEAYDLAGQWTDSQLEERIAEVLNET